MARISLCLIALILFVVPLVHADNTALVELLGAHSIKCEWGKGIAAYWKDGKLKMEITLFAKKRVDRFVVFTKIDLQHQRAQAMGSSRADVIAVVTSMGINFIEETPLGCLTITTVFAETISKSSKKLRAVHSRHMYLPGFPAPQQYYGVCEIEY